MLPSIDLSPLSEESKISQPGNIRIEATKKERTNDFILLIANIISPKVGKFG
jgi:hypothetical protein